MINTHFQSAQNTSQYKEKIIQQTKSFTQKAGVINDLGIFRRRCEEQSALRRPHRRRDGDSSWTPR